MHINELRWHRAYIMRRRVSFDTRSGVEDEPLNPKNDQSNAESDSSTWKWMTAGCTLIAVLFIVLFVLAMTKTIEPLGASSGSMAFGDAEPAAEPCPAVVYSQLPRTLEALRARIRAAATSKEAVTWPEYAADPVAHAGRHVRMAPADFAAGTLRIKSGGLFTLTDDVTFAPNADDDFRPALPAQASEYGGPAYTLGFFAAIAVEAPDVVIDLQGHTLASSTVFATEQRFFACIELANQPFLHAQGPAEFGAEHLAVDGLVIENGTLGRSSHHGMHGNGGRNVLLQDLVIRDFEVAAVALNGFTDVVIRRVQGGGTFTNVPVLGTYSNARFLVPAAQRVLAATEDVHQRAAITAALQPLQTLMAQVRADVAETGRIRCAEHAEACALFNAPSGLSDGGAYGLLLHPVGAAVHAFWHLQTPPAGSPGCVERILVQNCTWSGIRSNVTEVVALVAPNGTPVRGPVGDVLRLTDNAGLVRAFAGPASGAGPYASNALVNAQIALIDASLAVTNETRRKALFGTVNGDANVVRWARGELTLAQLIRDHGYSYQRNGDTMFHVLKGMVAVRMDGVRDACLDNVRVTNTANLGLAGVTRALPGEASDEAAAYTGSSDGGHPAQGQQYGYLGADARGVGMAATHNIHISGLQVHGVHSHTGNARGIDLFNTANVTHAGRGCAVSRITALTDDAHAVATGKSMMGPKIGQAIGVRASASGAVTVYGMGSVRVENVTSRAFEQAVFMVIDATPEHASVALSAAELANAYGL